MGDLNLGPESQPGGRSYIPPHMRNRPGGGPPVMNGAPQPGPPMDGPPPAMNGSAGGPPMNGGLSNSAWAK
jgi:ATP-dependent RNA helicase DDX3X